MSYPWHPTPVYPRSWHYDTSQAVSCNPLSVTHILSCQLGVPTCPSRDRTSAARSQLPPRRFIAPRSSSCQVSLELSEPSRRFGALGLQSTCLNRRTYRVVGMCRAEMGPMQFKKAFAYLGVDVHDLILWRDQFCSLLSLKALQSTLIFVKPQELLDVLVDPLVVWLLLLLLLSWHF